MENILTIYMATGENKKHQRTDVELKNNLNNLNPLPNSITP